MIRDQLNLMLAQNTEQRISKLVNSQKRIASARVLGWNSSAQAWNVSENGNIALVRNISNANIAIGDRVAIQRDLSASLGWIDAKPR